MKLIGVTGRAGSGKTTFSDMLAENSKIGVIHIDDILREIKLKYFKLIMKEDSKGEKVKVDSNLKTMLYSNKILFNMFMRFRAKLIEKPLISEISKLEKSGKKTIIIDDIFLRYQKCYKDLSLIFLMERPFTDRRDALIERDNLSKEDIVASNMAHHKGNYKEINNNNLIEIVNNKSQEELYEIAIKIYEKYLAPYREKIKNLKVVKRENIPEFVNVKFKSFDREER